ncbi:MAG: hypothetical protein ABXS91_02410 [Sulfurimonas sp.]
MVKREGAFSTLLFRPEWAKAIFSVVWPAEGKAERVLCSIVHRGTLKP